MAKMNHQHYLVGMLRTRVECVCAVWDSHGVSYLLRRIKLIFFFFSLIMITKYKEDISVSFFFFFLFCFSFFHLIVIFYLILLLLFIFIVRDGWCVMLSALSHFAPSKINYVKKNYEIEVVDCCSQQFFFSPVFLSSYLIFCVAQ